MNLSDQLIVSKIYLLRGKRVMLDADLAQLLEAEMANAGERYEQLEKHIELVFATLKEMVEPLPKPLDHQPLGY